MILIGNY